MSQCFLLYSEIKVFTWRPTDVPYISLSVSKVVCCRFVVCGKGLKWRSSKWKCLNTAYIVYVLVDVSQFDNPLNNFEAVTVNGSAQVQNIDYNNIFKTRHNLRWSSTRSYRSDDRRLQVVLDWPWCQPNTLSHTLLLGINREDNLYIKN